MKYLMCCNEVMSIKHVEDDGKKFQVYLCPKCGKIRAFCGDDEYEVKQLNLSKKKEEGNWYQKVAEDIIKDPSKIKKACYGYEESLRYMKRFLEQTMDEVNEGKLNYNQGFSDIVHAAIEFIGDIGFKELSAEITKNLDALVEMFEKD